MTKAADGMEKLERAGAVEIDFPIDCATQYYTIHLKHIPFLLYTFPLEI